MNHSNSCCYTRTFRAEVLKELLAGVSGAAFWLGTPAGEKLSHESWQLADRLLLPEYDNDSALDSADKKLKEYQNQLEQLKRA